MRKLHFTRLAGALMLLALSGYAAAQERITLRIADQKGGMRSQPTPCRISPTRLNGPSFRPPRRWRKRLTPGRWMRG